MAQNERIYFYCPDCGGEIACYPGEVEWSGRMKMVAKCKCGLSIVGYAGKSNGMFAILDERRKPLIVAEKEEGMNDAIYSRNKWYREAMDAISNGVEAEDIIQVMAETLEKFEERLDEWMSRSQR